MEESFQVSGRKEQKGHWHSRIRTIARILCIRNGHDGWYHVSRWQSHWHEAKTRGSSTQWQYLLGSHWLLGRTHWHGPTNASPTCLPGWMESQSTSRTGRSATPDPKLPRAGQSSTNAARCLLHHHAPPTPATPDSMLPSIDRRDTR